MSKLTTAASPRPLSRPGGGTERKKIFFKLEKASYTKKRRTEIRRDGRGEWLCDTCDEFLHPVLPNTTCSASAFRRLTHPLHSQYTHFHSHHFTAMPCTWSHMTARNCDTQFHPLWYDTLWESWHTRLFKPHGELPLPHLHLWTGRKIDYWEKEAVTPLHILSSLVIRLFFLSLEKKKKMMRKAAVRRFWGRRL